MTTVCTHACCRRSLQDGILESYWGEHIHLGYYNEEERKKVRQTIGKGVMSRTVTAAFVLRRILRFPRTIRLSSSVFFFSSF